MFTKEDLKKGWLLSNNERGDIVIQKNDDSDRFKTDDEATEFVVKSHGKLLKLAKKFADVCRDRILTLEEELNECYDDDYEEDIKERIRHYQLLEMDTEKTVQEAEGEV